jgi:hypothetical protein
MNVSDWENNLFFLESYGMLMSAYLFFATLL